MRTLIARSALLSLVLSACVGADPGSETGAAAQDPAPSEADLAARKPLFPTGAAEELRLAENIARERLDHAVAELGLDARSEFHIRRTRTDDLGMAHVRFQQALDGVPVFGGEAIVHLHPDGSLRGITDELLPDVDVDTTPALDEQSAVDIAVSATTGQERLRAEPQSKLWVLRRDGADHLVWRVRFEAVAKDGPITIPVVFVDAHSGEVLWTYDDFQTGNANGSGESLYDGVVGFKTWYDPGTQRYYLEDNVRDLLVPTLFNEWDFSRWGHYYATNNYFTTSETAVQATYGLTETWDYFYSTFGRDGIDGAGGPGYHDAKSGLGPLITGGVHYGDDFNNAGWNGSFIVFGDGDGTNWSPLVSVDIAAHEWTHGITQYEADLIYSGESGGLNESMSDVFAAAVEATVSGGVSTNTWLIGEDAITPGVSGDALRYMNNPAADGASYDYYSAGIGSAGVHYSSGVGNLAFYLVSQGGSHPTRGGTAMSGVGITKAAAIWYRALTTYLTSTSDYADAREATLRAAADLYGEGGPSYRAVFSAWRMVGLTSTTCPGYDGSVVGSVSSAGDYDWMPGGSAFYADGEIRAMVHTNSAGNLSLQLYKYDSSTETWSVAATSATSSTPEWISYSGSAGYYGWLVSSASGSASYRFCYSN